MYYPPPQAVTDFLERIDRYEEVYEAITDRWAALPASLPCNPHCIRTMRTKAHAPTRNAHTCTH